MNLKCQIQKILVAFAWCHEEELCFCQIFSEFLGCDVTFGVTKERIKLFLIAGIDVNNKIFTCFHSFMPSKQASACHWDLRVVERHFLLTLSLNQCIACDQELAMYQPLREIMINNNFLKRSCSQLDKYFLLQKEWKDKVECKVNSS